MERTGRFNRRSYRLTTFNGGDIGRLSICGTVNDVSMLGAIPA